MCAITQWVTNSIIIMSASHINNWLPPSVSVGPIFRWVLWDIFQHQTAHLLNFQHRTIAILFPEPRTNIYLLNTSILIHRTKNIFPRTENKAIFIVRTQDKDPPPQLYPLMFTSPPPFLKASDVQVNASSKTNIQYITYSSNLTRS